MVKMKKTSKNKFGIPERIVEIEFHPGHGKYLPGAIGQNGKFVEHTEAVKFTKAVYNELVSRGVPANYYEDTTSKTQTANVNGLVAHHNKDNNGLIVSNHFNASQTTSLPMGVEVLYANSKWEPLAAHVSNAISKSGGFKNRGSKYRNNVGVLTKTVEPAILIEVAFVDSSKDVELYRKNFNKIVQSVADSLAYALGYTYVDEKPATTNKPSTSGKYYTTNPKKVKFNKSFKAYKDVERTVLEGTYKKDSVITIDALVKNKNGTPVLKTKSGTYVTANKEYSKKV